MVPKRRRPPCPSGGGLGGPKTGVPRTPAQGPSSPCAHAVGASIVPKRRRAGGGLDAPKQKKALASMPRGWAFLCFGTTEAPSSRAMGPPSHLHHRRPCCLDVWDSFALGSSRPPPHGCGGVLCFGTTEAPPCWRGVLLRFGTTQPPPPLKVWGASFTFVSSRPLLPRRVGLRRFQIIKAPAAWLWGPPSLWEH